MLDESNAVRVTENDTIVKSKGGEHPQDAQKVTAGADREFSQTGARPIDSEGIIDAALSLLNQEGLNRLSMRRLADSLGVQAASLYWHIKNKSELLQLMADKICEKMDWPDGAGMPWREKVRRGMVSYREALLQYRDQPKSLPIRLRLRPTACV